MKGMQRIFGRVLFICILIVSTMWGQDTEATRLLKARNVEFRKEVIKVTEDVYTAMGYSVQPVSMIVGNDSLIIVDTGMDTISSSSRPKPSRPSPRTCCRGSDVTIT